MRRIAVESSHIKSVGYDEATKTLEIEFHRHPTKKDPRPKPAQPYRYFDVPMIHYEALIYLKNKGSYFEQEIKGKFRFEKVPVETSCPYIVAGQECPDGHKPQATA